MWAIATLEGGKPALVVDGKLYPLAALAAAAGKAAPASNVDLFADWEKWKPVLAALGSSAANGGIAPAAAKLSAPLIYPGKVLCAGANYYDHMAEMGFPGVKKEAQRLFFFFKPPRNALVGPGRTVRYPKDSKMFDWEVELAAVIGKTARRLTMANALEHVAAYSIGIDLSARDLNRAPETFYKLDWVAGKAQDTCCPLGPRLVPAQFIRDPQDLALKLSVNGQVKQDARTSGMIFDIREQLVTLSAIMTLDPGDIILTGTPAGVGMPKQTFLKPGDRVDAEIESIGKLSVEIGEAA